MDKNFPVIKELVNKFFGLDGEGFKDFCDRLDNPVFTKNIAKILKDKEDRRFRYDLPDLEYERFDEGWKEFSNELNHFVSAKKITYQNYRDNLVQVGKQQFKIKKVLFDYYKEKNVKETIVYKNGKTYEFNSSIIFKVYFFLTKFLVTKERFLLKIIANLITSITKKGDATLSFYRVFYTQTKKMFEDDKIFDEKENGSTKIKVINMDRFQKLFEPILEKIEEVIIEKKKVYYNVGGNDFTEEQLDKYTTDLMTRLTTNKISKDKKIQLVISGNFADMMLASSGETWGSCINMESNHSGAFWAGLPGLVGDPNRVIVYVTDGKKKNYAGIETDRYLSRAWGIETEDGRLAINRWYPNRIIEKSLIEELTGLSVFFMGDRSFRSAEKIKLINIDVDGEKRALFIYNDSMGFEKRGNDFFWSSNGSSGFRTIVDEKEIVGETVFQYSGGLKRIIANNETMRKYLTPSRRPKCACCGSRVPADHTVQTEEGRICHSCYESLFVKTFTGRIVRKANAWRHERLGKWFTEAEKAEHLYEARGDFWIIGREVLKLAGYDGYFFKEEITIDFKGEQVPIFDAITLFGGIVVTNKDYELYGFNDTDNEYDLPKAVKKSDAVFHEHGWWVPTSTHVITRDRLIMKKNDKKLIKHTGNYYNVDTAYMYNVFFNEETKRWYQWKDKSQREFKFTFDEVVS